MTNGEDEPVKDQSLPGLLPAEADEVTEAAPPIERRATPRTPGGPIERSRSAAVLVASGILLSRLTGLIRQTMMARYLGAGFAAEFAVEVTRQILPTGQARANRVGCGIFNETRRAGTDDERTLALA